MHQGMVINFLPPAKLKSKEHPGDSSSNDFRTSTTALYAHNNASVKKGSNKALKSYSKDKC